MSRRRLPLRLVAVGASAAAAVALARRAWSARRPSGAHGPRRVHVRTRRVQRNVDVARLGASVGATYASTAARKLFASAERRVELDRERELRTAEAVAERLGSMKGALMKLGQMASYLDDGLPAPLRDALAQLQASAPPMSGDLAAEVIEREFGRGPDRLFVEWDADPIAAASIGQTVGGRLQLGHDPQLLHGVMQHPRDGAQLLEHLRRRGCLNLNVLT